MSKFIKEHEQMNEQIINDIDGTEKGTANQNKDGKDIDSLIKLNAKKKKKIKIIKIVVSVIIVSIAITVIYGAVIFPAVNYNRAIAFVNTGQYDIAYPIFEQLDGYKDTAQQVKEAKLREADSLIASGDYDGAYKLLDGLNYKDSDSKLNSIIQHYKSELKSKAKVGSYVFFGSYEQDCNDSNGKEYIEWLILDKTDNKILVISRYALDCKRYNESWDYVTWEKCTLRQWLNDDFINEAFSSVEKKLIAESIVPAGTNTVRESKPGNATRDKVFLLSIDEANKYFGCEEASEEAIRCAPTDYAESQGLSALKDFKTSDGEAACDWWLRSPGQDWLYDSYVMSNGLIYYKGGFVFYYGGVRPALWISLE